jgi:PAS domain S-box-containing protein
MSTIRKRLEISEMCNSGVLYRKVIDNVPHRIAVKDIILTYVFCNEAYAQYFNMTPNEIVGKSDYDFFPKELAEKIIAEESEILKSGAKKETIEKYVVSGKELTTLETKTPIINHNDGVIGLQVMLQDITKDIRRTESLAYLIINLEDMLVQNEAINDALKIDLERITVRRNADIEQLKKYLQRETTKRRGIVELLQKYFEQFRDLMNSAEHLTRPSNSEQK